MERTWPPPTPPTAMQRRRPIKLLIAQLIPMLSVDGLIGVCIEIDAFLDARVCQPYKQLFCFANYSSSKEKQRHEGVLRKISQVNVYGVIDRRHYLSGGILSHKLAFGNTDEKKKKKR